MIKKQLKKEVKKRLLSNKLVFNFLLETPLFNEMKLGL